MAKSQQTYSKSEKEKKRLKSVRKSKRKKKLASWESKGKWERINSPMLNHDGNLNGYSPPDPIQKK